MPLIRYAAPRIEQPQEQVGINTASEQARGLVWYPALNEATARDLSESRLANATTSTTIISTPWGVGRRFNGSTDVRTTPNHRISNSTAWSQCCWVRFDSFANAYNTVLSAAGSGGANNGFRDLHVKSNGKLALYVDATTLVNYDGTGAATLSTGVWYHLALTYSSAAGLVGYVNAVVDGTAGASGNARALAATPFITIGNNPPNFATRFIDGSVSDVRFYDRALTPAEIREIYENPEGLFAPRSIWVPVSAGGVTGSLSATLGALTSTATGTLPIVGSASATLGALTSTATGTLSIAGQLNQTLGALTLAATGALGATASGQLTQTLGALTVAATGRADIAAALGVTLGSLSAAGAGRLGISSAVTATLDALSLAAAGQQGAITTRTGTLSSLLGQLVVAAEGRGNKVSAPPIGHGTALASRGRQVLASRGRNLSTRTR